MDKNIYEVMKVIEDTVKRYHLSKKIVFRVYDKIKSIEIMPKNEEDIIIPNVVVERAFYAALLNGMRIYVSQSLIDGKSFPTIVLY